MPEDYSGQDLRGLSFRGQDLREASFRGADLRGADLTKADLSRATAVGADFTGARMTGTCLEAWNIEPNTSLDRETVHRDLREDYEGQLLLKITAKGLEDAAMVLAGTVPAALAIAKEIAEILGAD